VEHNESWHRITSAAFYLCLIMLQKEQKTHTKSALHFLNVTCSKIMNAYEDSTFAVTQLYEMLMP